MKYYIVPINSRYPSELVKIMGPYELDLALEKIKDLEEFYINEKFGLRPDDV